MKIKVLAVSAAVLVLLVVSALAADVAGKWTAQVQGRQGTVENTFNFKVDGTSLTGTMSNPMGETEISEGKINGDEISFVVVRTMMNNEIKILYKGKVAGDEIKFTREFQGGMGGPPPGMAPPANAPGPGAGAPPGGQGGPGGAPSAMEFVAKRVK